ncbi:uncharacterized protein LOC143214284 isoform X2 [Lasioglossum baleicum]|uniref:uncharacterized protein LOC143214284 isoform X2 n=1 Tax=Lasioglossum baleicum TaxID=434251 RepID=UPI003FCC38D6
MVFVQAGDPRGSSPVPKTGTFFGRRGSSATNRSNKWVYGCTPPCRVRHDNRCQRNVGKRTWSFSIRLAVSDDRWTRPMSITWLSSDLGASKCYHAAR